MIETRWTRLTVFDSWRLGRGGRGRDKGTPRVRPRSDKRDSSILRDLVKLGDVKVRMLKPNWDKVGGDGRWARDRCAVRLSRRTSDVEVRG